MQEVPPELAVERYRGYLVCLARSLWDERADGAYDLSDLVQQTLMEAHVQRGSFAGRDGAQFAAWLRRILANNLYDAVRARRRAKRDIRLVRSLEDALDASSSRLGACLAADQSSPSERAAGAEELCRLADALARLPDAQRQAVTLHHLRGCSLVETAGEMDRSVAAVAGLLRRGLKGLRELMDDRG